MTREEAIKVLSSYDVNGVWADVDGKPYNAEEQAEAFDMAIEALQDRPIGTWHTFYRDDAPPGLRTTYYCSHCGEGNTYGKSDFCPMCGADMRGSENA